MLGQQGTKSPISTEMVGNLKLQNLFCSLGKMNGLFPCETVNWTLKQQQCLSHLPHHPHTAGDSGGDKTTALKQKGGSDLHNFHTVSWKWEQERLSDSVYYKQSQGVGMALCLGGFHPGLQPGDWGWYPDSSFVFLSNHFNFFGHSLYSQHS